MKIYLINEKNAEAFLPLFTTDAREEFAFQYLNPSADMTQKDIFALGIAEDDQVVGAICFYYDESNAALINSIFIREAYRRQGYGTELVIAVADFCQTNALCTRLEVTTPSYTAFDNNLNKLFDYLEFEKEELTDTGCYEITLADVVDNELLKKIKPTSTLLTDTTRAQKNSLDELAYIGLTSEVLNQKIDADISTCFCEKNDITDCMMFSVTNDNLLELTWSEVSPKHPAAFMDLLAHSVAKISEKYKPDQTILIPYVNEHSKNLILKILGDKAKVRETYTRYWIDLDEPYEDDEE